MDGQTVPIRLLVTSGGKESCVHAGKQESDLRELRQSSTSGPQ